MKITTAQLKYLAELVDWDTTGKQDDPFYQELIELWETLDDGDSVLLQKSDDLRSINLMASLNVLSTRPKVDPMSPPSRLRNER